MVMAMVIIMSSTFEVMKSSNYWSQTQVFCLLRSSQKNTGLGTNFLRLISSLQSVQMEEDTPDSNSCGYGDV